MNAKKVFLKGVNWALAAIITMLGFAGCNAIGRLEYGSPYADYVVKGTVVDQATKKPIEGILVSYSDYDAMEPPYSLNSSATTNVKGEFSISATSGRLPFQIMDNIRVVPVYVQDIDGELNGLYESTVTLIDFRKGKQTKKSKGWYEGEYTVNLNIELIQSKIEEINP
ncbi:MAG: radical SAM-associated putative lipoprotein [Bacteroidales bacterium]|nr:radical SAM-associated putative lipoprotein [Bacteroidales bacterium]